MLNFYKCEIIGSISDEVFSCYTEAYYNPDNGESNSNAYLKAENKVIQYYDNNLTSKFGEIKHINIMQIKSEEYYGMLKKHKSLFL